MKKMLMFLGMCLVALLLLGCPGPLEGVGRGLGVGGGAKTVVLDTANTNAFGFRFSTETMYSSWSAEIDITPEPWCTQQGGLCGNWVDTGKTNLADVTAAPAGGYISDVAGYEDCKEVTAGHVYVNKNKDGTYAKFKIVSDAYTNGSNGCDHKLTIEYEMLP